MENVNERVRERGRERERERERFLMDSRLFIWQLGISRNPSGERLAQAHPDVATSCPGPEGTNVHGQQGTCTVEIRSTGSSNTSMETLTLYLEKTRRSGGGKLQRPIRQDGTTGRCYATFENAESEFFTFRMNR